MRGRSRAELWSLGKSLRDRCPRRSHAAWKPPHGRPDPVRLLELSNRGRIPELVPLRIGRMVRTPFTFYRGAALNMAADLARTPATGVRVQACGDCHLLNFGDFATPERRVIFDLNDLDETLPAPWEWDLKRLAASLVLASRYRGFARAVARDAARACARAYRERMAEYSEMSALDVWYARIDVETVLPMIEDRALRRQHKRRIAKALGRNVREHDFPKLAALSGRGPRIRENHPLIYHPAERAGQDLLARSRRAFAAYRQSLQEDRRVLLDRYELVDVAIKVVGVGSVGTLCAVMLLMAGAEDPLFLQIKEARASVLEAYAGRSVHPNHGQRVVNGYRLMQSASDLFLGWARGELGRHVYVRQLRDVKVGPIVESFSPSVMVRYGEICGWTLARSHARSGEPATISGYLGRSGVFDEAIAEFSVAYADQTERDHRALEKAVRSGRVEVMMEPD